MKISIKPLMIITSLVFMLSGCTLSMNGKLVNEDGYITGKIEEFTFNTRVISDVEHIGPLTISKVNCGQYVFRDGLARGWKGDRYYFNVYNMGGLLKEYQDLRFIFNNSYDSEGDVVPNYDLVNETYHSFNIVSLEDYPFLQALTEKSKTNAYDYSDTVLSYYFSLDGIDNRFFNSLLHCTHDIRSSSMSVYVLRQEKDGIPITAYSSMYDPQYIAWDDYCLGHVARMNIQDCIDYENMIYVPIDIDPYNETDLYRSDIYPIKIDDCILNCIDDIRTGTANMGELSNVEVYLAELTYVKVLAFNTEAMELYGVPSYHYGTNWIYWLIPTWKVHYYAQSTDGKSRMGSVYLNAETGEGMAVDYDYLRNDTGEGFF